MISFVNPWRVVRRSSRSQILFKLDVFKNFGKPEAATGIVLQKNVVLKICEILKENICVGVSF